MSNEINIKDSIWSKYQHIVEANKAKRKICGTWSENEPQELILDETCINDDPKLPWDEYHLLSQQWVSDLFGNDWTIVCTLLIVQENDIVIVGDLLYYKERAIRNCLNVLQCLAKTEIVNELRPLPQMIKESSKPIYTNKDMMNILNVKESTLRSYRDNGLLGYTKQGDKIWYTEDDLMNFINNPKNRREAFA